MLRTTSLGIHRRVPIAAGLYEMFHGAFGCLKCDLRWFLCPFPGEQNTQQWAQLSLLLPSVRSHSPVLPQEQEVCPETNPQGLPKSWEAQVCLINLFTGYSTCFRGIIIFIFNTFPPFGIAVWDNPLESVRWTSFSHRRTWRNLQIHTDVSAQLIGSTWKEKLIIVEDSRWSVHLQVSQAELGTES